MESQKIAEAVVSGLKEAGINFVTSLPSSAIKLILPTISSDTAFKYVPVANEGDGISVSFGSWLGGKKPAFLGENLGLILGTYQLLNIVYRFGGFPLLLVIDHRGAFGDGVAEWWFGAATQLPRILESFQVPYTIVRESEKVSAEIVRGQKTAEACGRPAAVLLCLEKLW